MRFFTKSYSSLVILAANAPAAAVAITGKNPPFRVFLFFVSDLYCSFTNCLSLNFGSVFSGSSEVPNPL